MSINAIDVITRLPFELEAMLEADDYFTDIPVAVADKGNVEKELERKRIAITKKSGKVGVGVVVLPMVADDENPNMPFGPLVLRPAFQVFEQRTINTLTSSGTLKPSVRIARRIRDIVKGRILDGIVGCLNSDKPCIEPITFDGKPDLVGHQVNFFCHEADTENVLRVEKPALSPSSGAGTTVTITCATAGASIYYTTDDSFPWSGNANATLYSGAITIPALGFTLRVCAFKTGYIGSHVPRADFTHS